MSEREVLISDSCVTTMPIVESGEVVLDARGTTLPISDKRISENPHYSFLRRSVLAQLLIADASLPAGYRIVLEEGWRPRELQEVIFGRYLASLSSAFPLVSIEDLRREATRYVARPDGVPPHCTGGAVDVVLATTEGLRLDMGSDTDDTPQTGRSNYLDADVGSLARRRRDVLGLALTAAGFVNYPPEWWHWSIGDQYWAYRTGSTFARFGPVGNVLGVPAQLR